MEFVKASNGSSLTPKNKAFLLGFSLLGLYPQELWKIHKAFGTDFESAWKLKISRLSYIISSDRLANLIKKKEYLEPEKELTGLDKQSIKAICLFDQEYPFLLKQIDEPPLLFYCQGTLSNLFGISFVGSRKISSYGQQAVQTLIPQFSLLPVSIVSGLAFGVDALSHQTALENNIHTVAVLGSGIDQDSIYPRQHRELAKQIIASGGALISEFPPGMHAQDFHFPLRNRIIAGLSRAIVIVEAKKKSGALITAKFGLDFNRDVYAVPGSILAEQCEGTNRLIQKGARPLLDVQDFIVDYSELQGMSTHPPEPLIYKDLGENQQKILANIASEGSYPDEIQAKTGLSISEVNAGIMILEIKGYVSDLGGNHFALKTGRNLTSFKKSG